MNLSNKGGKRGRMKATRVPNPNPQLFDDTSNQQYGYPQNPPMAGAEAYPASTYNPAAYSQQPPPPQQDMYGGQQYLQDPMANMAMQYGQNLAGQGQQMVTQNIEKYVSKSKLKTYFFVDTSYVGKKLGLLLFPFLHKDWSVRYNQDEPVAPRYELNAPDLYIPVMGFVTYILVAGLILGIQDRFTPEQLGITSSSALVWLIIEILILLFSLYVMNVSTDLRYLDLLAYCGYKYVGMILSLVGGLLFQATGYYLVLLWTSICIVFFLVRSLKMAIVPHTEQDDFSRGNKRRMYMLLFMALTQPLFMWWLTSHLMVWKATSNP